MDKINIRTKSLYIAHFADGITNHGWLPFVAASSPESDEVIEKAFMAAYASDYGEAYAGDIREVDIVELRTAAEPNGKDYKIIAA